MNLNHVLIFILLSMILVITIIRERCVTTIHATGKPGKQEDKMDNQSNLNSEPACVLADPGRGDEIASEEPEQTAAEPLEVRGVPTDQDSDACCSAPGFWCAVSSGLLAHC